ncbi:MAG TPA: ComEC/Rec2 family competence protein, partial [Blastocatellia bacterium]|nr:ComEC/Rec2 family competence protein [Blastocatellia bacterium]
ELKIKWQREIASIVLLFGFAVSGAALWRLNESRIDETRIRQMIEHEVIKPSDPVEIIGRLSAAPELAPDRIYLSVDAERVTTLGKELKATGTVQLLVAGLDDEMSQQEYDALQLDYGSRVRVLAYLRNAHGYRNPGAVNFDELLEHRGYDATGSIKTSLLIDKLGNAPSNRVLAFLYRLRARGIAVILHDFKQPTQGILIASLFGNQHFLSRETAENFRASGTFHLLVISGLHVAMLAAIAMVLVKLLTKWLIDSRALRFVLVAMALWFYALMVGAQPAITRATVMLTIVLFAQLIFRVAPGANTLAASALALLIWNPRDYLNPSFQLSFATVASTILLAAAFVRRLQRVGAWRPSSLTPYPPRVFKWTRWLAEVLFWNEAKFRSDMKRETIHYKLDKVRAAQNLSTFSVTELLAKTRVARFLSQMPIYHRFSKSRIVRKWRESNIAKWWGSVSLGRIVQWCLTGAFTAMATTIIVQISLLPMMIAQFHRVSFISPIANITEGALMFLLMITSGIYLLVRAIAFSLLSSVHAAMITSKMAGAVQTIGALLANTSDPLRHLPKASFRVPDFGEDSWQIYLAYFVLLAILIYALDAWNPFQPRPAKSKRPGLAKRWLFHYAPVSLVIALLMGLATALALHPFSHAYEPGRLSITFLDVGQGDAMLISFPQGRLMLLDSGGQPSFNMAERIGESIEVFREDRAGLGEIAVAPYLWYRGIKRLDAIAASHAHPDHTEGFKDIVNSFEIGEALTGVLAHNDEHFDQFKSIVSKAGIPMNSLSRGQDFEWDGVRVEVLAPFAEQLKLNRSENDESLVLRLRYGKRSFLLTGDIERKAEAQLVATGCDLRADVLKVAHHGSRTSSTKEFVGQVKPQFAVISVAAPSPFGHPHKEALENLQSVNAKVLQTSQCGAITFSTNGEDLRLETFVKCQ